MLNTIGEILTEELAKGNAVQFVGFGAFQPTHRDARETTNPHTGEKMETAPYTAIVFRPGKILKDAVNHKCE